HGDLLRGTQLDLAEYRPSATLEGGYPTTALVSAELNGDGDLDLVVGSAVGAIVYHGAEGTRFVASREALPGTGGLPASSVAEGDFDGDGDGDMAVACEVLACAFILTRDERGDFLPALTVDIPAGDFIGTGDLDGDGFADLVGSGEVLWTALSSRKAKPGEPPRLEDDRERIRGVVLNEILAINNLLPLKENGGRKSDWIELYNGSGAPFSLAGARVRLEAPDANPAEYTFLEGTVLEDGGHLVLVASKTPGALHLGFKVPGGGGTIVLLGRSGEELDRVRYPGQFENVSFGRFRDGLASFSFNPYPSPGAENADNGPVPPQASLLAVAPARSAPGDPLRPLRPGEPIRFFARARDDVGVMSMSVLFRRLGSGDAPRRVFLFDDGMHGDGGMQDGLFSGTYEAGLWPGGSIEFHLEVLDLSGETVQVPEEAFFGSDPSLEVNYRLGVESAPAGLEISELVALNASGLLDEAGGTADWVEVRNCSAAPMSLGGVYLGDRFPENEGWFAFPADATLAPGQQVVVFCDGDLEQGPLHAPFRLDGDGGRLVLMRRTPEGGHALLDAVDYGAQADDVAWGRTGCGGGWERMAPSPRSPNPGLSAAWGDVDLSRALDLTDPIAVLNYLFRDGKLPCPGAADVTRDSKVDISDPISLLQYLFLGGGAPPGGWTSCG
ncbi:MAG: lamin tail domain-containing protein, partial [Planctomycetes bacterium]|nr:lamin tail domain-containing protein [Planctomycetota bacterium]